MNIPASPSYKRHRFPVEIISHAVWLYFRFSLRYRDVEELRALRGIVLTYETIRQWCEQFSQPLGLLLRFRQIGRVTMKSAQSALGTVNAYIAAFPPDVQAMLEQLPTTIRQTAPDAQEAIRYAMPTCTLNGRYLVYFAAYKKHIGLYPAPVGVAEFHEAVSRYGAGKGTLQFPLDQPLPLDLIRCTVQFRIKENSERSTI